MPKISRFNKAFPYIILLSFIVLFNCKSDDDTPITIEPEIEETPLNITENIELIDESAIQLGYILAVENGADTSYLIDKGGNKIKQWNFDSNLGNDIKLLPDGTLLGMFKTNTPSFTLGGYGGVIKIINSDSQTIYEYNYSDDIVLAHHDVKQLPNGNFLFIAWQKVDNAVAIANGFNNSNDIFPETLVEIDPTTDQIVWKWNSMDHIVQDHDNSKLNYNNVNDNPQLIDINYNSTIANGDIMHANGIDYDPIKDIIYLSINFYSEVWVIDHSTSTTEAASNTGGNYNKGGDLIYRFGNPEAYKNTTSPRLFYNNHAPTIIDEGKPGENNVLVYMNGSNNNQSIVYEFKMPVNFSLNGSQNNEPEVIWSFTDPNLYNGRISGAVRLRNGNTLICEGDYGYWEVTTNGTVVWKYSGLDVPAFWRGYDYYPGDEAIINLGL